MQVSAPIRIVALIGVLAALAMGAWMFTAGRTATDSSTSSTPSSIEAARTAASKLSAHNKATAAGKPDVVAPVKKATVTPAAKPKPAVTEGGAPTTIAAVLRHHKVAVVVLYDPESKVHALSLGEAQLGADQAHAGFLRVSVLEQRQAEPFAKTYGILQLPAVLFFARPGKLVQKLVGFADQDTVAQAALNASRGVVAVQG